jgi:hypothetical protein
MNANYDKYNSPVGPQVARRVNLDNITTISRA